MSYKSDLKAKCGVNNCKFNGLRKNLKAHFTREHPGTHPYERVDSQLTISSYCQQNRGMLICFFSYNGESKVWWVFSKQFLRRKSRILSIKIVGISMLFAGSELLHESGKETPPNTSVQDLLTAFNSSPCSKSNYLIIFIHYKNYLIISNACSCVISLHQFIYLNFINKMLVFITILYNIFQYYWFEKEYMNFLWLIL